MNDYIGAILLSPLAPRSADQRLLVFNLPPQVRPWLPGCPRWPTDPSRKAKPVAALVSGTPPPFSQLLGAPSKKDPRKRCASYDEAYRAVRDLIGRTQQTQRVPLPPVRPKAKPGRGILRTGLIACGFAAILLSVLALLARLLP